MELKGQSLIKQEIAENQSEQKIQIQQNNVIGYWKEEEHKLYIVFVDFFRKQLNSKEKRRSSKIFKAMAQFVGTRNAIQCRSHHMKIIRTFRNIQNLLAKTKKKLGQNQYAQYYGRVTSGNRIFDKNSIQYQNITKQKNKHTMPNKNRKRNAMVQAQQYMEEQGPLQTFGQTSVMKEQQEELNLNNLVYYPCPVYFYYWT